LDGRAGSSRWARTKGPSASSPRWCPGRPPETTCEGSPSWIRAPGRIIQRMHGQISTYSLWLAGRAIPRRAPLACRNRDTVAHSEGANSDRWPRDLSGYIRGRNDGRCQCRSESSIRPRRSRGGHPAALPSRTLPRARSRSRATLRALRRAEPRPPHGPRQGRDRASSRIGWSNRTRSGSPKPGRVPRSRESAS